uniref:Ig-like domain-containing protein n=1 Tax=Knipowitschia caucasica TaxID=637954 RepID=A0AAV2LPS1_KNICA
MTSKCSVSTKEVCVPVVSCVNVSSDSVTLQCSVKHTEQTTLSWFRGGQSVVSSSSAVLPLTVQQRNYTHQYKCVSQNPVGEKTATVKITEICTEENTENKHWSVFCAVPPNTGPETDTGSSRIDDCSSQDAVIPGLDLCAPVLHI